MDVALQISIINFFPEAIKKGIYILIQHQLSYLH